MKIEDRCLDLPDGEVQDIIPCTTPTWAVYAAENEWWRLRVLAWNVARWHSPPKIYADLKGVVSDSDYVGVIGPAGPAEASSNFVGYWTEGEEPLDVEALMKCYVVKGDAPFGEIDASVLAKSIPPTAAP